MAAPLDVDRTALQRNVRLIPLHQAFTSALVWIPVFVLFTRARFDLEGALLLASLYYLFVVLLEVPSGWMSDRFGRVITLRLAAVSWVGAHLCFALGDDRFAAIVLGQFLLALGFASLSGTDVTFHYDTLEALGEESSYADRQARVASLGFAVTAVSALVGGALGLIDLRLVFVASFFLALGQLVVTSLLTEPPSTSHAEPFVRQLATCLRYLRQLDLGWLFLYGVILVTLEHVAFTMMQPWLTEVLGEAADDLGSTPLLAGLVFAVVSLVGSGAARASAPLGRRFGLAATLLGFAALSGVVVTAMALFANVVALLLVIFRSAQGAAAPVLIAAAVAPRTARHHRATLLSLNSLAGRLGYGVVLLVVSTRAGDDVQGVLGWLALLSWALIAVLVVAAVWVDRRTELLGRAT